MSTIYGWAGKILRVNFTTGAITTEDTLPKYHDYVGGMGIGYKIIWDEVPMETKAYDEASKVVIAVGICACSGGIFHDCYNVAGGIDKVIPVDVYVPGCAARPQSIIDGVVKGLEILERKRDALAAGAPVPKGTMRTADDDVPRVNMGHGAAASAAGDPAQPEAPAADQTTEKTEEAER